MVTSGLMEFWPGFTVESLCAMICLASARVHFEVKSDAGSCACLGVLGRQGEARGGRRHLGARRRIRRLVGLRRGHGEEGRGGDSGRQSCGGGAPPQHPGWCWGACAFFALLAELNVRGRRADALVPRTPEAPLTRHASSRTPLCRGRSGVWVGPRLGLGRFVHFRPTLNGRQRCQPSSTRFSDCTLGAPMICASAYISSARACRTFRKVSKCVFTIESSMALITPLARDSTDQTEAL